MFSLKFILLFSLLIYLFDNINIDDLLVSFQQVNFYGFLLSMVFCFLSCYVLAKRWVQVLKNRIDEREGLESIFICLGLNNVLPGKGGEILQLLYLKKNAKLEISFALPSLFIIRMLDIVLLFSFMVVGSYFNDNINFIFLLVVISFSLISLFVLFKNKKLFLKKTGLIKHKKLRKLFANSIKTIVRIEIKELVTLLFYTIAIWLLYFLYLYIFILFGTSFNLTIYESIIVFIFISIGAAIPISPGGIGTVHIGAVLSLGWFGIDKPDALAFAIVFHLVQYFPTTIIGIMLFYKRFSTNIFSMKNKFYEAV